jgi:hypothetical protein
MRNWNGNESRGESEPQISIHKHDTGAYIRIAPTNLLNKTNQSNVVTIDLRTLETRLEGCGNKQRSKQVRLEALSNSHNSAHRRTKSKNLIKWPPKIMTSSGVDNITENISTKKSAQPEQVEKPAWASLWNWPKLVTTVFKRILSKKKLKSIQMGSKNYETSHTPWITYLGSMPKRPIQKAQSLIIILISLKLWFCHFSSKWRFLGPRGRPAKGNDYVYSNWDGSSEASQRNDLYLRMN